MRNSRRPLSEVQVHRGGALRYALESPPQAHPPCLHIQQSLAWEAGSAQRITGPVWRLWPRDVLRSEQSVCAGPGAIEIKCGIKMSRKASNNSNRIKVMFPEETGSSVEGNGIPSLISLH